MWQLCDIQFTECVRTISYMSL